MTEEMMRQLITVQREQLIAVTAERDELRRALDRTIRPVAPVAERHAIKLSTGRTISLVDWRDITLLMDCNNSDLTTFYLTKDDCRDLRVVAVEADQLALSLDCELLLLSANCSDPDVSLLVERGMTPLARLSGLPLLAGEPFVTGPVNIRSQLHFRVRVDGPRRRFRVHIRALYKGSHI